MTFNTEAVVLGYENRNESDRIYHLFTDKHGKVDVLARGGQKILSKLAPHLEPPALAHVLIAKGRFGDKLAGSQIKNSYPNIRKDFARREILFFCFKIVDWTTRPEEKDERVYEFLKYFLDFFENTPASFENKNARQAISIYFLLNFFPLVGFRPENKAATGKEITDLIRIFEKLTVKEIVGKNIQIKKEFVDFIENWVAGILEKKINLG